METDGAFESSWKSGLTIGLVQSNQFLRRGIGRGGGCDSCQHSFHNNDITTLTSSSSCAAAGQRYIITLDEGRKKDADLVLTCSNYSQARVQPKSGTSRSVKVAASYTCQINAQSNDLRLYQRVPPTDRFVNILFFLF